MRNRKNGQVPQHNLGDSVETTETPGVIDLFVNAGADVNVRDSVAERHL